MINKSHIKILESLNDTEPQVDVNEANEQEIKTFNDFKKVIEKNPVNKKIQQIASKYGYVAGQSYMRWYGSANIHISPKNDDFHPAIYYSDDDYGKFNPKFEIQTTSYGSLDSKEYADFLKGCTDAYNMVKELEKIDVTKLAKEPEGLER